MDAQHVDLFFKMVAVHGTFGILVHCFVQHPSFFLQWTPPFSTFIKSLISFDCSFHKVFERLLGLKSFDNPEGPLGHKQSSLPITFGGIGFIFTSTIAPTTDLGN
jgi:hypothetical protein